MCVLAAHVNEIRVVTYSSYLGYKFYCYKVVWVVYFSIGYGLSDFFLGFNAISQALLDWNWVYSNWIGLAYHTPKLTG